jgi:hypothetical protein
MDRGAPAKSYLEETAMTFKSIVMTIASVVTLAAPAWAQFDPRDPSGPGLPGGPGGQGGGYDLSYDAQAVEHAAQTLLVAIAREPQRNAQLVSATGMVAKEAHDIVLLLSGQMEPRFQQPLDAEVRDVLEAFETLRYQLLYAAGSRPSGYEQQQFYQLDSAVQQLQYAYGGGSGRCTDPDFC